ncbi:putative ribonuclease H-like domain-containing protein [Tanacetum coccineum]
MNELCAKKGIKREFSVARTPQQNGVAERKNRTLIEAARTMLADSLLPIPFWAEAVNTACYVLNRVLCDTNFKINTTLRTINRYTDSYDTGSLMKKIKDLLRNTLLLSFQYNLEYLYSYLNILAQPHKLQLADATGIHNLSDAAIYAGLATLGDIVTIASWCCCNVAEIAVDQGEGSAHTS